MHAEEEMLVQRFVFPFLYLSDFVSKVWGTLYTYILLYTAVVDGSNVSK